MDEAENPYFIIKLKTWLVHCDSGWISDKEVSGPLILRATEKAINDFPQLITLLPSLMVEVKCNKGMIKEVNTLIASIEVLRCLGSDE